MKRDDDVFQLRLGSARPQPLYFHFLNTTFITIIIRRSKRRRIGAPVSFSYQKQSKAKSERMVGRPIVFFQEDYKYVQLKANSNGTVIHFAELLPLPFPFFCESPFAQTSYMFISLREKNRKGEGRRKIFKLTNQLSLYFSLTEFILSGCIIVCSFPIFFHLANKYTIISYQIMSFPWYLCMK